MAGVSEAMRAKKDTGSAKNNPGDSDGFGDILSNIKVLTFDCYGTLIDWEAGILAALRPWAERERVTAGDEELLEAFAKSEHRQEQSAGGFRPYPEILTAVFGDIARDFTGDPGNDDDGGKKNNAAAAARFANSVGDWPPFGDTTEALQLLKQKFRLMIISNVDRASFARTQESLGVEFDAVVTAEDVRAYKPDPRPFEKALEVARGWGAATDSVLHIAQSLFHDHVPAQELGLRTVWVDRRGGKAGAGATPTPEGVVKPDWVAPNLSALVTLLSGTRHER